MPDIDLCTPTPYIVDTRIVDDVTEILLYKLAYDSWNRPYYKPSGLDPLTEYEACCIVTALAAQVTQ